MPSPDIISDFYPYVRARIALASKLDQVAVLRDQGKLREARKLLGNIEASQEYKFAKQVEERYAGGAQSIKSP